MKLYVSRKVLNPSSIIKFMNDNNFLEREPIKDLHVTVAYSSKDVDETKVKLDKNIVEVDNIHSIEKFGDYWVLILESEYLQNRYKYYIDDIGCSYDFDSYRPHISISKSDQDITPKDFNFSILLGGENMEELKE